MSETTIDPAWPHPRRCPKASPRRTAVRSAHLARHPGDLGRSGGGHLISATVAAK